MKRNLEDITNKLKNNNIRPSHQRLKVLEFLDNNRIHPTVEQIYHSLYDEIPTLSKTTIYNTLNTLIEAGLVRILTIEDNEVRYDIRTDTHGHFKCKSCGNIYDFEVDMDLVEVKGLNGFRIYTKDVYFSGICSKCLEQEDGAKIFDKVI
ncbi:MAG TPA: transcriptional repressor [Clostridiaceae bacterium]|nr:transcriptional repressor [Clostridiaceae bacterium]